MKRFLLIATVLLSFSGMSQNTTASIYPVLANPNITDVNAGEVDANQLFKNEVVRFTITVVNPSQSQAIKAGSCILQIELGNKFKLAYRDVVLRMAYRNYFTWLAVADEKGNTQLQGKLIADLPIDFAGSTSVELQCIETGHSSIKAQWVTVQKEKIGSQNEVDFTIKKGKPKD